MAQPAFHCQPKLAKNMKNTLPQAISDYFAAVNDERVQDAAACFAPDALVHDENHDHAGSAAILSWIENTTRDYQPKAEVIRIEAAGGTFVVTATVSGTFPGSPVELAYSFTVSDGKIARLSIQ